MSDPYILFSLPKEGKINVEQMRGVVRERNALVSALSHIEEALENNDLDKIRWIVGEVKALLGGE